MTIRTRYRTVVATAAVALVAPLALVAITATPANAAVSKHKHEVTMYKVEKYIKLAGGGPTSPSGQVLSTSLSCSTATDKVLDGMWLIQHVDQYNAPNPEPADPDNDTGYTPIDPAPYPGGAYNDERDVQVWESYPDAVVSKWNFKFENFAYGDAQLKVWVLCIKSQTESAGAPSHKHTIGVSAPFSAGVYNTAAGVSSFVNAGGDCTGDQYFVAPGFKINNPVKSRLVGSNPITSGKSWHWNFYGAGVSNISLYGKCIDRRVGNTNASGGNHAHAIAMLNLPGYAGHPYQIFDGDVQSEKFTCDEDEASYHGYKAAVGWFTMSNHWDHHWFLGMEPQPKTRVYWFMNRNVFPETADITIGALCINSRTGNPINPW